MQKKLCGFSIAHTNIKIKPFNNHRRTLRVIFDNNLFGEALQVKFSNIYGGKAVKIGDASIALCDENGNFIEDTMRPLTFNGRTCFVLNYTQEMLSDEIPFKVEPGQKIAVSIYYPRGEKVRSGNSVDNFAIHSLKGNFCRKSLFLHTRFRSRLVQAIFPWDVTSCTTTVSQVIVKADKPAKVVAAFGDSITQQSAWTSPLTKRLYAEYPGQISFSNLGIGGNRLLHDAPPKTKGFYGLSGVKRFRHDIMGIEGLTHVILALGTNDLGLAGKDGAPMTELISADEYVKAVTKIAQELHKNNIKLFCATILPRAINAPYNLRREEIRKEINGWIRTADIFDAVFDFDKIAAEEGEIGLKKEYNMGDGLHINHEGGEALCNGINTSLFF